MVYADPKDPRRAESSRKHYEKNRVVYLERAVANKQRAYAFVRVAKAKPCMDCGVSYPYYVMDFDHRGEDPKIDAVSRLANNGASDERLAAEIAKCDLVCANCHRQRTATRSELAGRD